MTDGVFNELPPTADDQPVDVGVLQKRFQDSQSYIAQLETEAAERNAALAELENKREADRLLMEARIKAATPAPSPVGTPPTAEPAKSFNEDELVERVLKAQAQRQNESTQQANAQAVVDRLTEMYGSQENANKIVSARAAELGVGKDFLLATAKQSPKAFYDLMKLEQDAPRQQRAPQGNVNVAALQTNAPGVKEGSNAWYENLRNEIGAARFYTPKIQQQRMKDAQRLGDAFFT